MAGLMVVVVFVYHVLDFGLETADKMIFSEPLIVLIYNALISISVQAVLTGHYFFIKTRPRQLKYFTAIQSVVLIVGVVENKYINDDNENSIHILTAFITFLTILQSMTIIGICQVSLAASYIIIWLYTTLRVVIGARLDLLTKAKMSSYLFFTLASIFLFQRYNLKLRRDTFLLKLDTKEVFSLVHKIMRFFHDGILITSEKEIIFKNRFFTQLLLSKMKGSGAGPIKSEGNPARGSHSPSSEDNESQRKKGLEDKD